MKTKLAPTAISKFLALTLAATAFASPTFGDPIAISSQETLLPLVQKWSRTYGVAHSESSMKVDSVATSEAALDGLKSHKNQIAVVSRRLKRKEVEACAAALGSRPNEYKVAVSAVAVYVHPSNTIKALDLDLLESICKGETKTWKDAGAKEGSIAVYLPKDSPRVLEYVRDEFLAGKEIPSVIHLVPASELAADVAKEPNALGFGDALAPDGVRVVGIKRAQSSQPEIPTVKSITEMDYPVAHYVYQVIAADADKEAAKSWLDWVRSDEGQAAIDGTGFYAIPVKQRSSAAK